MFPVYRHITPVEILPAHIQAEDAWRIITTFEDYSKWNSVCLIDLCGPLEIGTDILIKVVYPGLEVSSREMISVLQKPSRIGWSYKGLLARLNLVKTQRDLVIQWDESAKALFAWGEISFGGPLGWFAWGLKGKGVQLMLAQFNKDLVKYCSDINVKAVSPIKSSRS